MKQSKIDRKNGKRSRLCSKSVCNSQFLFQKLKTRRDRLKSAPYLRLKNIQRTTIGNIWKNYFFQKKIEIFFSEKSIIFRKSHNAEKLKKRPFRLIKRFYKPKTSKNCKGLPFDRVRKFSKKTSHSAEKIKRKKTFGLASTFGSIKNLWFSARIEPTISGFSEN